MDEAEYTSCKVRVSEVDDGFELYEEMRIADFKEIIGLDQHPWTAVRESFTASQKKFSLIDREGKLIAMFGVAATHVPTVGCVWMLGTDRIRFVKRDFIRNSKAWVNELMGDYRCLVNLVSSSNKISMRWLKWLGADFLREKPKGYLEFMIPKI